MSSERPKELPQARPDDARLSRGMRYQKREERRLEEERRLRSFSGPAFMGTLMAALTYRAGREPPRGRAVAPPRAPAAWATIDSLNAFYAARPRPWRPRAHAPKQPALELQRLRRRRSQAAREARGR